VEVDELTNRMYL